MGRVLVLIVAQMSGARLRMDVTLQDGNLVVIVRLGVGLQVVLVIQERIDVIQHVVK